MGKTRQTAQAAEHQRSEKVAGMDRHKHYDSGEGSTREKKLLGARDEFPEAEKAVRAAAAKPDPIAEFPSFLIYNRNGLKLNLEAGSGAALSATTKESMHKLLMVRLHPHNSCFERRCASCCHRWQII